MLQQSIPFCFYNNLAKKRLQAKRKTIVAERREQACNLFIYSKLQNTEKLHDLVYIRNPFTS